MSGCSRRRAGHDGQRAASPRAMRALLVVALLAGPLGAGCEEDPAPETNLEYMPDMVASVAYDSFAPNPNTRDGRTLMAPPAGTIPRGYQPLHFVAGPAEATRAGRELTNPVPDCDAARQRGGVGFQRWCSPCHGHEGLGDGLVALRFPRPPSLVAPHAKGLPDGQIFHIVTFGQGLMPPYGQQIVQEDRWKIARYVRQLQASAGALAQPPVAAVTKPAAVAEGPRPTGAPAVEPVKAVPAAASSPTPMRQPSPPTPAGTAPEIRP